MQTPSLQKVTLTLVTEEQPQVYVSDAARLGFNADRIPSSLLTDLGNGRALKLIGRDSFGTVIYEQPKWRGLPDPIRLRVTIAEASAERKAIAGLRAELASYVETGVSVRAELAGKISRNDETALCALIHMHSAPGAIQKAKYAQELLNKLDATPSDEQVAVLRRCVKQIDGWLDTWQPNIGSHPLRSVFNAAEYEAVRELRLIIRSAIEPSAKTK